MKTRKGTHGTTGCLSNKVCRFYKSQAL